MPNQKKHPIPEHGKRHPVVYHSGYHHYEYDYRRHNIRRRIKHLSLKAFYLGFLITILFAASSLLIDIPVELYELITK